MLITESGPVRPHTSSEYMGECSECSFELGIAKPVPQFGDLRFVAIVQMLARAEDLDQRNAGVPDAIQPDGGQAMFDEEMRREGADHD